MSGRRRVPPVRQCIDCRGQVRAWSRHSRCADCERAFKATVPPLAHRIERPKHDGIPF